MIMPEKIREEQDNLFDAFMKSDEDITPRDFVYKYGSDEMRKFLDERQLEDEENRRKGIIVN